MAIADRTVQEDNRFKHIKPPAPERLLANGYEHADKSPRDGNMAATGILRGCCSTLHIVAMTVGLQEHQGVKET